MRHLDMVQGPEIPKLMKVVKLQIILKELMDGLTTPEMNEMKEKNQRVKQEIPSAHSTVEPMIPSRASL